MYRPGIRVQFVRALPGAIALCLAALPSQALVYQCKGADGSTVFSDSPCGADAKVIEVRPQAPLSNDSAGSKRAPGSASSGARNNAAAGESPDAAALRCQAREFQAWYKAQTPKPSREQSDAKMSQIVDSCWLSTHLQSASNLVTVRPEIKTVRIQAPQAVAGGMAAAPGAPSAPLQVSRSRQPEEAARWSSYYGCRAQAFQDWSDRLGHAPEETEARAGMATAESRCRAQFNIPAGAAAILID